MNNDNLHKLLNHKPSSNADEFYDWLWTLAGWTDLYSLIARAVFSHILPIIETQLNSKQRPLCEFHESIFEAVQRELKLLTQVEDLQSNNLKNAVKILEHSLNHACNCANKIDWLTEFRDDLIDLCESAIESQASPQPGAAAHAVVSLVANCFYLLEDLRDQSEPENISIVQDLLSDRLKFSLRSQATELTKQPVRRVFRLEDFAKRASDNSSVIKMRSNSGLREWSYLPVHLLASDSNLDSLNWRANQCTACDVYCRYQDDVTFLRITCQDVKNPVSDSTTGKDDDLIASITPYQHKTGPLAGTIEPSITIRASQVTQAMVEHCIRVWFERVRSFDTD